jgi:hypothetical protein
MSSLEEKLRGLNSNWLWSIAKDVELNDYPLSENEELFIDQMGETCHTYEFNKEEENELIRIILESGMEVVL